MHKTGLVTVLSEEGLVLSSSFLRSFFADEFDELESLQWQANLGMEEPSRGSLPCYHRPFDAIYHETISANVSLL
jgi:hypothetical protein